MICFSLDSEVASPVGSQRILSISLFSTGLSPYISVFLILFYYLHIYIYLSKLVRSSTIRIYSFSLLVTLSLFHSFSLSICSHLYLYMYLSITHLSFSHVFNFFNLWYLFCSRFCGSKLPHPLIATDSSMLLVFKSDASVQRKVNQQKRKEEKDVKPTPKF